MQKLVLGTAQLGMNYGINNSIGQPSVEEAFDILDTSYENGITILDTAAGYGNSEEIIGRYMAERNRDFIISTKIPKIKSDTEIEDMLEKSLNKLSKNSIDYYFVHDYKDAESRKGLLEKLKKVKSNGLIKNIGISIYEPYQLEFIINNMLGYIDCVQIPFNVFDLRWINSNLLKLAKKINLKIFARSIFLQGLFFTDKERIDLIHTDAFKYISKLENYCNEINIPLKKLLFDFVKYNSEIDFALIGCETKKQVVDNIQYYNSNLSFKEEDLDFLKSNFFNIPNKLIDPRTWAK